MLDDMARAAGVYAGTLGAVPLTLYSMTISHPSQAARRMVEVKGVDYKLVTVTPMAQRAHLRAVGFRRGTVPAMKVDGKRVQGSRQIARALDERWPEPALFRATLSCAPASRRPSTGASTSCSRSPGGSSAGRLQTIRSFAVVCSRCSRFRPWG